ncbi:FAD/NAD(P)-binding domain-containing protein [Mytilinidion resinicola]|uniref:FAD/NAD(P)-binding domain-containing protein n=1 Tax=Mytilinidion resinicola TaxID=574789 RepID=A0A6A6YY67_9PEZI|nr:FAD/NAD(P)-binding domain-containing protein [Mytilinidion resinicola]KAF2813771.1 FAD/NAD(P)-binding domain-containing protein [Mytilinidion resinicola]
MSLPALRPSSSLANPLNILVIGAGVAGPALAYFLQSADPRHTITIIERSPSLRMAGQQIDLKAEGLPVLRKMGLMDNIKKSLVAETGLAMVDPNGKPIAHFGIVDAAKGTVGLTSEYEIMRGDLVQVLYDASLAQGVKAKELGQAGGLTYEFGKTVMDFKQDNDGVDVTFSDGQEKRYDLVVGADGQTSRTRRQAFGQEASDEAFKSLGIHTAYYSVPRLEGEGGLANLYTAPGRRCILTRMGDRPMTQVYLFNMNATSTERLKKMNKEPIEKQKEVWAETFKDAGWQADRFVSGLDTCDDFYTHEIAQVKMKEVYKGRVALLGDAGYCPSPFTGLGTTLSIVGAYLLAGELARHGNDVPRALQAYDKVARPLIDECQHLPTGLVGMFLPSSRLGVWIFRNSMWALSTFKINEMMHRVFPEDTSKAGWKVPDYPELNLLS